MQAAGRKGGIKRREEGKRRHPSGSVDDTDAEPPETADQGSSDRYRLRGKSHRKESRAKET